MLIGPLPKGLVSWVNYEVEILFMVLFIELLIDEWALSPFFADSFDLIDSYLII